jgi:hypothetical protein
MLAYIDLLLIERNNITSESVSNDTGKYICTRKRIQWFPDSSVNDTAVPPSEKHRVFRRVWQCIDNLGGNTMVILSVLHSESFSGVFVFYYFTIGYSFCLQ